MLDKLPPSCKGVGALSSRLMQLQNTLIRAKVPAMEKAIRLRLDEQKALLSKMPTFPRELAESHRLIDERLRVIMAEIENQRKGALIGLDVSTMGQQIVRIEHKAYIGDRAAEKNRRDSRDRALPLENLQQENFGRVDLGLSDLGVLAQVDEWRRGSAAGAVVEPKQQGLGRGRQPRKPRCECRIPGSR